MKRPLQLDEEEFRILRDFKRGEFESMKNFREEKRKLEEAARNTLQKDKRINIRISSRDLANLQKKAAKEGVPYQCSAPYLSSGPELSQVAALIIFFKLFWSFIPQG